MDLQRVTVVSPHSSVIYLRSSPQEYITSNFRKRRSFHSFAQHLTHDALSRRVAWLLYRQHIQNI